MMHKLLGKVRICRNADGAPGGAAPAAPAPVADPAAAPAAPAAPVPAVPVPAAVPEPDPATTMVPLAKAQDEKRKRQEVEKDNQTLREQLAYFQGMQAAGPVAAPAAPAPAAPVDGPPVAPKVEDFESFEAFQQADRQYVIDVATFNATQKLEQKISRQTQQTREEQLSQTFQQRLAKAAEVDPDLPIIASTFHLPGPNHIPLTPAMQDAIKESDAGPQILRYFANNKTEAARLAAMSPISALREIGRIEAQITAPTPAPIPTPVISMAPEPISTLTGPGTAGGETELKDLPMDEYFKRRAPVITQRR